MPRRVRREEDPRVVVAWRIGRTADVGPAAGAYGRRMSTPERNGRFGSRNGFALGIALGVVLGGFLSQTLDQPAYLGVGIALGVALGAALQSRGRGDDGAPEPSARDE